MKSAILLSLSLTAIHVAGQVTVSAQNFDLPDNFCIDCHDKDHQRSGLRLDQIESPHARCLAQPLQQDAGARLLSGDATKGKNAATQRSRTGQNTGLAGLGVKIARRFQTWEKTEAPRVRKPPRS